MSMYRSTVSLPSPSEEPEKVVDAVGLAYAAELHDLLVEVCVGDLFERPALLVPRRGHPHFWIEPVYEDIVQAASELSPIGGIVPGQSQDPKLGPP
jgi:hypothetical protein